MIRPLGVMRNQNPIGSSTTAGGLADACCISSIRPSPTKRAMTSATERASTEPWVSRTCGRIWWSDASLPQVRDRFPVYPGRFPSRVGHARRGQPVGQSEQLPGHGPDGPDLLGRLAAVVEPTHAGDDGVLGTVESSAPAIERFPRWCPHGPAPRDVSEGNNLICVLGEGVGANLGCVTTSRARLTDGLAVPRRHGLPSGRSPPHDTRVSAHFHDLGCRAAA